MTVRNEQRTYTGSARDDDDRIDVVDGSPADRVRWGPILAGTFAALTIFAVLNTLGAAIGLSTYDPGDERRHALGAGVWGVISLLLSFGFGGWLAARSAAARGSNNGLLNGFMVAGVGIPVLMFVLGSASALAAATAIANHRDNGNAPAVSDNARQASAVMSPKAATGNAGGTNGAIDDGSVGARTANSSDNRDDVRRNAARTAWGTLVALILAIGAASVAGLVGAKDDGTQNRHRHTTTTTTIGTGRGDTVSP